MNAAPELDSPARPIITPRLIVARSSDAIEFYERVFGAIEVERYTSPEGVVVHAAISISGAMVALADEAPDWGNVGPGTLGGSPVILTLAVEDPDAVAKRAEQAGGTVLIPIADQFYGHREGRIRDPFGHLWILSKVTKEMSPDEIQKGVDTFGKG